MKRCLTVEFATRGEWSESDNAAERIPRMSPHVGSSVAGRHTQPDAIGE